MAGINTWDILFAKLQKDVVEIMNDIDRNYKNDNDNPKYVMMQHVDSEVYQTYTPEWYETSFQLRDSIEATEAKIAGDIVEVGLYHNSSKMKYDPSYPRHGSKEDIREYLPDIIEGEYKWGVNSTFPAKEGERWNRKTMYQEKTREDLRNGRFKAWLLGELIRKGYTAE